MANHVLNINTILHTKDGSKIGNAIVTGRDGYYWEITTDYGNKVKLTSEEIDEQFDNNENMRNLISKALNNAFTTLENQIPQTKKKTETISIQDVKPSQLMSFMKSNDIPNDAYFTGTDNGYDGWNDIVLAWEVDVPTSEKEKSEYKNYRFHDIAFKKVYDLLTTNGYKIISERDRDRVTYKKISNSLSSIIMFDNKSVYEMYMDKDLDKLVEYYSMYFQKEA